MFSIDYLGYQVHNADCDRIFRPSGTASHLFLLILSPMTFHFPGRPPQKARPGACVLYPAGARHDYHADKEFFNSYVHFFCETSTLDRYEITSNEIFYPDDVQELNSVIKKLHQESIRPLMKSEEMISVLLNQLLLHLHRHCRQTKLAGTHPQSYYPELLALRETMISECEHPWNVDQLCSRLSLGKSQFYLYYERYFGRSPKQELLTARLDRARYLLSNEATTIKQAAYDSGFDNICHFNRLFKKNFGCAPGEYRDGAHHIPMGDHEKTVDV